MVTFSPVQGFTHAAAEWLQFMDADAGARGRFISQRSLKDIKQYTDALCRFFGGMKLEQIHIGNIREYQKLRCLGELGPQPKDGDGSKPKRTVGPNKVNQEVGTLIRILRKAKVWTPEMQELYMPLQREESDIPQALAPEEQDRFLRVAASRPEWQFVHWYAILGIQCVLSTIEERSLKIGDVNLFSEYLVVRPASAKNKYRIRTIPLGPEGRWAIERMLERAAKMTAAGPHHFLMPFGVSRNVYDPLRPMTVSGIKKSWEQVRRAAALEWFTPYDLRHTGCTRLAEAGTPISVIMDMAGHITERMRRHYTHISEQAKRKAIQSAFPGRARMAGRA